MAKLNLSAEHKDPMLVNLHEVIGPLVEAGFSNIFLEIDLEDDPAPLVPGSASEAPL